MSSAANRLEPAYAGRAPTAIDHGLLGTLLSHEISRANVLAESTFHAVVEDRSITPLRFSLLELVGSNPGLQQVQLADVLELSRPAITGLVDYWQSRSCVERRPGSSDRRSFGIYLTDQGARLLEQLRKYVLAHDRMLAASLDEDEQKLLAALLGKLLGKALSASD